MTPLEILQKIRDRLCDKRDSFTAVIKRSEAQNQERREKIADLNYEIGLLISAIEKLNK